MRNNQQLFLLPLVYASKKDIKLLKEKQKLFDWEIAQLFNATEMQVSQYRYKHDIKTIASNEGEHRNFIKRGQGKYNEFEKIAAQFYIDHQLMFQKAHPLAKYDFVVEGIKIDVKGAHFQKHPDHPFRLHLQDHFRKRCDFLHGICFDKNMIYHYFIPTKEINCTMISLRPFGKSKWNTFLNVLPFKGIRPLDKLADTLIK